MFGNKIKSLGALKDVAAENVTADQLAAVNAELVSLGFAGVELAVAGTVADATETVNDLQATLSDNAKTIKGLQDEVATLKGAPAAEATVVVADKDKSADPGDEQEENDGGAGALTEAMLKRAGLE